MLSSVRRRMRISTLVLGVLVLSLLGTACGGGSGPSPTDLPNTLHVLAGSELKDVEPMLPDIYAKTGITLKFDYVGTLTGAEQIANGDINGHALAWFSSTNYLSLLPGGKGKLGVSTRIALSPVVIGVKHSVAQQLGWSGGAAVTWKDIAVASAAGKFHFGMTNPAASNTGFSALVGVASALSGSTNALTNSDINGAQLTGFFKGLQLTAGSSGFLADSYVNDQSKVDGLINYESVLLGLNAGGKLGEPLDLIYPKDGIVTADYPLVLLDSSQRPLYDKLVTYLLSADVQKQLMVQTARRPVTPGVALDNRFSTGVLIELPFPGALDVVQTLIEQYLNVYTRPSHTFYVLDLSGSMQGDRLSQLQSAFHILADPNSSGSQKFARFRDREEITIITFNDQVLDQKDFVVNDATQPGQLKVITDYVDGLQAGGGTAIYDAMDTAFQSADKARTAEPDHLVSVVLMTDGENNAGEDASTFITHLAQLQNHDIPAFPILFGEGNSSDLQNIATTTHGKLFDSTSTSLAATFQEIRGYQ